MELIKIRSDISEHCKKEGCLEFTTKLNNHRRSIDVICQCGKIWEVEMSEIVQKALSLKKIVDWVIEAMNVEDVVLDYQI